MKVGMVTPSVSREAGGISELVRSYAIALNKIPDTELSIFGLKDRFTSEDLQLWAPLQPQIFSTVGIKSFGFAPGITASLIKNDISICHLHILWMYTSIATLLWAFKKKRPYVITTHGLLEGWALNNSKVKKQIAAALYERKCLKNAGCIHAITEAEFASIRNYNLKNPVCVIPSGIRLPEKNYDYTEAPWKNHIQPGEKVLLYFGRIHLKKGLINLIKAWGRHKKGNGAALWKLVIAGWDQSGHEACLKDMVKAAGLEKEIFFIGPQFNEEKDKCYFHANACILPSFSEGLPLVVLEAWSFNLPVLMTPECHIPEGFATGAALKMEPNEQSITSCLNALFEMNEQELSEMGKRGSKLVEERFSLQQSAKKMRDVYQWLLGEGDRPDTVILK